MKWYTPWAGALLLSLLGATAPQGLDAQATSNRFLLSPPSPAQATTMGDDAFRDDTFPDEMARQLAGDLRAAFKRAGIATEIQACDGSRIRASASRRKRGIIIGSAGLAGIVLSPLLTQNKTTMTQFGPVVEQGLNLPLFLAGAGAALFGGYLWGSAAKGDETRYDDALRSLVVGVSTERDVTECLGTPVSVTTSTSASGEVTQLLYAPRGSKRTIILRFDTGVLASIERRAISDD